MSIIKNVLFAVLIVVILQSVLLFNAMAEPVTTIPGDTTVSESETETSAQTATETSTLIGTQITSGTRTSTKASASVKTTTRTNSGGSGSNYYTKSTTTHAPVPYYLEGKTYASTTVADPNATTTTTAAKKTSGLGKSFYSFVWVYIPLIILCIAGLIYVNTIMVKKNKARADDDNEIYSQSKNSKQKNKKRIK